MAESIEKGEHVEWTTPQGKTEGVVEKKLTSPTDIKQHHVAASQEDPEYLVKSDKSGKEAAHKLEELQRKGDGK